MKKTSPSRKTSILIVMPSNKLKLRIFVDVRKILTSSSRETDKAHMMQYCNNVHEMENTFYFILLSC